VPFNDNAELLVEDRRRLVELVYFDASASWSCQVPSAKCQVPSNENWCNGLLGATPQVVEQNRSKVSIRQRARTDIAPFVRIGPAFRVTIARWPRWSGTSSDVCRRLRAQEWGLHPANPPVMKTLRQRLQRKAARPMALRSSRRPNDHRLHPT